MAVACVNITPGRITREQLYDGSLLVRATYRAGHRRTCEKSCSVLSAVAAPPRASARLRRNRLSVCTRGWCIFESETTRLHRARSWIFSWRGREVERRPRRNAPLEEEEGEANCRRSQGAASDRVGCTSLTTNFSLEYRCSSEKISHRDLLSFLGTRDVSHVAGVAASYSLCYIRIQFITFRFLCYTSIIINKYCSLFA